MRQNILKENDTFMIYLNDIKPFYGINYTYLD